MKSKPKKQIVNFLQNRIFVHLQRNFWLVKSRSRLINKWLWTSSFLGYVRECSMNKEIFWLKRAHQQHCFASAVTKENEEHYRRNIHKARTDLEFCLASQDSLTFEIGLSSLDFRREQYSWGVKNNYDVHCQRRGWLMHMSLQLNRFMIQSILSTMWTLLKCALDLCSACIQTYSEKHMGLRTFLAELSMLG